MKNACPKCGRVLTANDFMFSPKPHRLKCRNCGTVIRYESATWLKCGFFFAGFIAAMGAAILVLSQTDVRGGSDPAFWLFYLPALATCWVFSGILEAWTVGLLYEPVEDS